MSGSGRSSSAVAALPVRPLAWLVVPFVALLQFVTPVLLGTSPAAHAAAGTPSDPFTLKVVSARTVGGDSPIKKGDPVLGSRTLAQPTGTTDTTTTNSYKWLITADDNGNPTDSAANCLPVALDQASGAPKFNADGTPVANTAYAPGHGSYGTWDPATPAVHRPGDEPAVRRVPVLPVAVDPLHPGRPRDPRRGRGVRPRSAGHLEDARLAAARQVPGLRHRHRLQDRRRALHRRPGRQHPRRERRRRHVRDGRDAALPAAARNAAPAGVQGHRAGRRHLRGGRRARSGRLRNAHQRRPRRGDHRLLRQPPLHQLRPRQHRRDAGVPRADRPELHPAGRDAARRLLPVQLRRQQAGPVRRRLPRHRRQRPGRQLRLGRRRSRRHPEPRPRPLHGHGHPAERPELVPDDDARGQPRLGHVDPRGRHRLRPRVHRRRRAGAAGRHGLRALRHERERDAEVRDRDGRGGLEPPGRLRHPDLRRPTLRPPRCPRARSSTLQRTHPRHLPAGAVHQVRDALPRRPDDLRQRRRRPSPSRPPSPVASRTSGWRTAPS